MSDYRHATDRIDGKAVAECPNGCQSWQISVNTSIPFEELFEPELTECSHCGADMDVITHEIPSEVLR